MSALLNSTVRQDEVDTAVRPQAAHSSRSPPIPEGNGVHDCAAACAILHAFQLWSVPVLHSIGGLIAQLRD